jgi:WD40 repeat protein
LYLLCDLGVVQRLDTGSGEIVPLPAEDGNDVLAPLADPTSTLDLVCSGDGRWLVVSCFGDYNGAGFRVLHVPTGKWSPLLPERSTPRPRDDREHPGLGACVAISPDSSTLAVAGARGLVSFWGLPATAEVGRLIWEGGWLFSLAFSPDGQFLATGDSQGAVRLWPWRRLLAAR